MGGGESGEWGPRVRGGGRNTDVSANRTGRYFLPGKDEEGGQLPGRGRCSLHMVLSCPSASVALYAVGVRSIVVSRRVEYKRAVVLRGVGYV